MSTKVCKRCGAEKPIDQFRPYYDGRKGTYSFCKTCERIEQRRKYLVGKADKLTDDERVELDKIDKLYELHKAAGRQVPEKRCNRGLIDIVDQLLAEYENK